MTSSDLLDLTTLRNLVELDDGGYGLVKEMAALFREDTPHRIQDILRAIGQKDAEALSRASHALKGGAGTMGAKVLRGLAAELESQGRDGFAKVAEDLPLQLEAAFQAALSALETYVSEGEGKA